MENLIDELVAAIRNDPDAATGCGARLVELHCSGPAVFSASLALLGKGLLALPELANLPRLAEKVVLAIGAFAGGCTEAVRSSTLAQQEEMTRAVRRAFEESKQTVGVLKAQFELVVGSTASGIALTTHTGRFRWASDRLGEILGYSDDEFTELSLFDLVEEPDELHAAFDDLAAGVAAPIRTEHRMRRRDGEHAWVSLALSSAPHEQFVAVVEDRSELNLLHGQLNHQALHDMLTRLPNRQFFTTQLERVLRHADPITGVTVYQLDLDAFSVTTLGLGRRAGDQLLEAVADRLSRIFADERAMVARFGADEFAVLVQNSPGTPDPVTMIQRINAALAEPVYVGGQGIGACASIGVVDRPPPDMRAAALLDAAELTLARAKRNGRNQWALFDPAQDAADRAAFSRTASLPGAWENGQIDVVYRPIVRLADERVIGLDAVLSWAQSDPVALRDMAERTGMIMPLGRWLLRSACSSERLVPLHVALTPNQSADPDLVGKVLEILRDTGTPPDQLWLAFPSPVLAVDEAEENLRLLADAGVYITLYGTTSDDLAYLDTLPVRAVRITPPSGIGTRMLAELVATAHLAGATVIVDGGAWLARAIGADATVKSGDTTTSG